MFVRFFIVNRFRMFSYGEFKAEDQEKMLAALNKKVELVYRSCIGDNEANIRYDVSFLYYLGKAVVTILNYLILSQDLEAYHVHSLNA